MQQLQQRDWCEQQIKEKEMRRNMEKINNQAFDQQALQFHDTLKWTQSEHNRQRIDQAKQTQSVNAVLAKEKKDRETKQHEEWAEQEKREIDYTNNHDFMTENQATETSMLAPHRVKPYHFKGFNQGQIDAVNLERQQQLREKQQMAQQAKEEEKAYAMQLEVIRRQQILADRAQKK